MTCLTQWLTLMLVLFTTSATARVHPNGRYVATAYTTPGTTASGEQTKRRLIAADPAILPLGSQIRVTGAGQYSGEYEVGDTGRKIKGRKLDIYIANDAEAKEFGVKKVRVKVIKLAEASK
jgi:3D (Asp-Asp-Asp) domain-containing protein